MSKLNERHIDTKRGGDSQGHGNFSSLMDFLNQRIVICKNFLNKKINTNGIVAVIDTTIVTGNIAVDLTSIYTNGGILAVKSINGIGTPATNFKQDEFGNIINLVKVRNYYTKEILVDKNNNVIYGLLQTLQSTQDGDYITNNNLQITFITIDSTNNISIIGINEDIDISLPYLYAKRHFPKIYKDKCINYQLLSTNFIQKAITKVPKITNVRFINGYPGSQTEVKENDKFDIEVTFDPNGPVPYYIEIDDFGACKYGLYNIVNTGFSVGNTNTAIIEATVRATSETAQALPCKIRAINAAGLSSDGVDSDSFGNIDGTHVITCNDIKPTFNTMGIIYPIRQYAFKDYDTGTIITTVNDFDEIEYSSPNNDFVILSPNVYDRGKTIQCNNPGHYNITIKNYKIFAKRYANDSTNITEKVIRVADIAPIVNVSQPVSRLRKGSVGEIYEITMTSNQELDRFVTLQIPVSGAQQNTDQDSKHNDTIFTNNIILTDGDIDGTGTWYANSGEVINLAGMDATIVGEQVVGGFTARSINLNAFDSTAILNIIPTDISKLKLYQSGKDDFIFYQYGTVPPKMNGQTIDIKSSYSVIILLDKQATRMSSSKSYIIIEEEE